MPTALFDPIKTQSKITDTVLVAFSGGKDSIVTLDLCVKFFKKVKPFFMWLAPELHFQENILKFYEDRYGTEIIRLPHFEVSNFMRYGSYREPDPYVPIVSISDVYEYLRFKTGIYWIAAGERIADSLIRRAMIKHSGSIDMSRGRFYPIAYWNKASVINYIKFKKLKLDESSKKLGFSFRSLHGAELSIIKQMYPNDFRQILRLYPLAEAGIRNYELRQNKQISEL